MVMIFVPYLAPAREMPSPLLFPVFVTSPPTDRLVVSGHKNNQCFGFLVAARNTASRCCWASGGGVQLRNIANEVGDTFWDELLYFDIEGIHVSDSDLGGMEDPGKNTLWSDVSLCGMFCWGGYWLWVGGIAYLNIPLVFPCPESAHGGSSPISIG